MTCILVLVCCNKFLYSFTKRSYNVIFDCFDIFIVHTVVTIESCFSVGKTYTNGIVFFQ